MDTYQQAIEDVLKYLNHYEGRLIEKNLIVESIAINNAIDDIIHLFKCPGIEEHEQHIQRQNTRQI